uniref:Uncharacterized protein n=1 Tax=Pseudictyota dubia TaxID=2749911 RepID=A0A7R9VCI8_9STRA|mmetsp:Transcript_10711/g.20463  ORF Transcript_10711/g.20463 Transcript_10711/m.20463 type:complete len:377 (+) Transcript_10711:179-1309(+)
MESSARGCGTCWNMAPQISADNVVKRTAPMKRKGAIFGGVGGTLLKSHESYFKDPNNLAVLEMGDVLFTFTCRKGRSSSYEKQMLEAFANLSSFQDETVENHVPAFDVNCVADMKKYTFVLQKCAYLLPNICADDIADPRLMSTVDYHTACQPKGTRVWTDVSEENTFRITKPIIPHVFSITMQLKTSTIKSEDLRILSEHIGVRIDRGLLMERTRRTKQPKPDATAKAKSVLLYTDIKGGVLVTHVTVVLNKGLPDIIANIVDTFGSWGLREVCETAALTRKYLRKRLSLSSTEFSIFAHRVCYKKPSDGENGDEPDIFYDIPREVLNDKNSEGIEKNEQEEFYDASSSDDSILLVPSCVERAEIRNKLDGTKKV